MDKLESIHKSCDVCQRVADAPWRFRVSIPNEDDAFNSRVFLDIMKLSTRSVLHAVDRSTQYNAARFLSSESTSAVLSTFDLMWVQIYVGLPDVVVCDQRYVFASAEWEATLRLHDAKRQISGVESHNAFGVGERYHALLRRVLEKVRTDAPNIPDEYALALAVKAANNMADPLGLAPELLCFRDIASPTASTSASSR